MSQRVTLLKDKLPDRLLQDRQPENVTGKRGEDDIYILELCSPPANLTDRLFFEEMAEVVTALNASNNCKGLIIRGRGRHFSSGADIKELIDSLGVDDGVALEESRSRSLSTFATLSQFPFPVVAAIQGCCLGSGMELALTCHYRVATKNALFSLPETGYRLMPGCGGTNRLPKLVGVGKSIEIILSGRNFLAEDALKMNLIDAIVDKSDLMETALQVIRRFGGKFL